MSELNDQSPLRLAAGDVDAHDWEQAAAAVLTRLKRAPERPADVWPALSRSTIEGVPIPALGTAQRSAGRVLPVELPVRDGAWDVRAAVFDADPAAAAGAALDELENGATSLWLTLSESGLTPDALPAALAPVRLDWAPVVVGAGPGVSERAGAHALAAALRAAAGPAAVGTNLGADPVGRAVRASGEGGEPDEIAAVIAEIAGLATDLEVLGFVVDGTVAHDHGAGEAAELGYAMAAGVHLLRALTAHGLDPAAALRLLEFRLAVTDDQFASIAKLRAARVLWARVAQLVGAPAGMRIHAVTSRPMTTRYDPWVNLLRTTVAAFAAGVGGADAITALPFDLRLGVPDAFGRRLARNIGALLIEESHVAAVTDPAAGAYAVEALTADLADAAWARFQAIERAGGVLGALTDGSLTGGWAQTAARRRERIARRRLPITGVSEFPNPGEALPVRPPWPAPPETQAWAADFEQLRDAPAHTPVFLATLGPVAEHAARAGFVTNLLAAGGVPVRSAGRTQGPADLAAAWQGEPVVVVAGADPTYAVWGADAVAALRAAGARTVILAGAPPAELASLVDDHVAAGQDAIDFLRRLRAALPTEVVAR